MSDPADPFDERLEARFQREHAHIEPEPFVRLTLDRVAAARARGAIIRRVLQGLALIGAIVASPWLIAGSVYVSAALDECFDLVSRWLATPAGMIGAALGAVVVVALHRWRVWR
jgi:hypothetical protein